MSESPTPATVNQPQSQSFSHASNTTVVVQNSVGKSTAVAYVLWFFFGMIGAHKFYLRKPIQGLAYLGLSVLGWATTFLIVGWVFLALVWLGLLFDLFLMPGQVRKLNSPNVTSVATTSSHSHQG